MTIATTQTHRSKLPRKATCGLAVIAVVVGLTATPAAAEDLYSADVVAEQIAAVAPGDAELVAGERVDDSIVTSVAETNTAIPMDGADAIVVNSTADAKDLEAHILLPNSSDLSAGTAASDGTVVFTSESGDGAVAVQTLEDGDTRIQTLIPDAGASHEFGYAMPGFRATVDDAGNASFVTTESVGFSIPVEAPWAVDANGRSVDTFYEVRGDELFQVVEPAADSAYPIIADPTWGWRNAAWGMTLSRSETASIKDYAAAAGFCAALVKNHKLVIACGVWGSYLQVQAATANRLRPKGCLHVVVAPLPGAISHTYC